MTMLSFRIDEKEAQKVEECASHLGIQRSDLLRDAVQSYLRRMTYERDAEILKANPYTKEELSFSNEEDWGPEEDWSDWSKALNEKG